MKEKWDGMSNEELCLEYQQYNSDELFEYFVNRNKSLIWYFTRHLNRKYPFHEDLLEQCSRSAMWDAMLRFDGSRKNKFSTYYYWYVLKHLRDFYEETLDIRLPPHVRERLKEFKEKHKDDNYAFDTISLFSPINSEDNHERTLEDILASDENLEKQMESKAVREELIIYIKRLSPRTGMCILDYFGFIDGIPKTLQILGDRYHVTRERIRQVISKGLKRIREWYEKDHPVD